MGIIFRPLGRVEPTSCCPRLVLSPSHVANWASDVSGDKTGRGGLAVEKPVDYYTVKRFISAKSGCKGKNSLINVASPLFAGRPKHRRCVNASSLIILLRRSA